MVHRTMMIGVLVVVHCQWCRPIVRQTQNSRRTKWLLRSLRRRRSRGEPVGDEGVGRGLRMARWVEMGRRASKREKERERENHSGIREWVLSTELIKTSPFNRPLSPPTLSLVTSHTCTTRIVRRRRGIGIVLVTVSR